MKSIAQSPSMPEFRGFGYKMAQIENNTHCNYKCWFCPNAYNTPAPRAVECMDIELFRKILLEIRSVYTAQELNEIHFSTYNEPNLDKTFKEKLQIMTDMGFEYEHVSNGSMITTELTNWLIEHPQAIKKFRLNIPTLDEKKWTDVTGASLSVMYRMYYQLMYLFQRVKKLNFPITVIVNGDGSEGHKEEFVKVLRKFQGVTEGITFEMTGLVNRAGRLEDAECKNQKIRHGEVDWGETPVKCTVGYLDNLYFGIKGNVYYCTHDYRQDFSYGNINEAPLAELLKPENYKKQKKEFVFEFCRKCEQASPHKQVF